jgi:hypothetical protein
VAVKPAIPAKILKRFDNFLRLTWAHLQLPPPDAIQLDLAHTLQYGPDRLIIEAFRGVGKSYITGAFCLWLLLNDPDLQILIVSASTDKARDQTTFMLRLLREMPILQHLAPTGDMRASMEGFDVTGATVKQSPSVRSKGITSNITGGRADVIIPDDVETPDNSMTQTMREKIREKVRELDNIIKPGPGHRIIYLGTPQLEDSLYEVLPERGYHTRIWPIRFPTTKERDRYGTKLAPSVIAALESDPTLAGSPLEPRRFGDLIILEKEASQGRSGFRLQYMLDTSLSDQEKHPLKLSDLVVMDLNPERAPEKVIWAAAPELVWQELPNVGLKGDKLYRPMGLDGLRDPAGNVIWQPYGGAVMAIDPSGRGQDETSYAVSKMLNSQVFVPDAGGFVGGYDMETLEGLARKAKEHGVKKVIYEGNFGDGMWGKLFAPVLGRIYPCTLEEVKATNRAFKEARIIDILEPVMNNHRLIIDRRVVERDFASTQHLPPEKALKYQLLYQLTRITRERGSLVHDDRLDALAWAVWYWVEQMSADADRRLQESREQHLQAEIDRFLEHALGSNPNPQTWM